MHMYFFLARTKKALHKNNSAVFPHVFGSTRILAHGAMQMLYAYAAARNREIMHIMCISSALMHA